VSVVAMGVFFFRIDLVGQGWLQLGYYIPVQVVGWRVWIRGGEAGGDLGVGWLRWRSRILGAAAVVAGTLVLAAAFHRLHGDTPYQLIDAQIVAASIAAQLLLTAKRIESWLLWLIPVDVVAIGLYLRSDAVMFAALYALYLVLASAGLRDWLRAWRAQQRGLSPFDARHVP
jgi:nicotinamide mononucleotide transporter